MLQAEETESAKTPRWERMWSIQEPERRLLGLEGRKGGHGGQLPGRRTGEGNRLSLRAAPGERACGRESGGGKVSLETLAGVLGRLRDTGTVGVTWEGGGDLGHDLCPRASASHPSQALLIKIQL